MAEAWHWLTTPLPDWIAGFAWGAMAATVAGRIRRRRQVTRAMLTGFRAGQNTPTNEQTGEGR
jgi:hypothetical protein